MTKETVRYPDALVGRIESFVTDSTAFESKSEYHRFASEFLLSLLDPDHDPSVLGYEEIFEDLEADLDDAFDRSDDTDEPFLETYIRVRRHLLRGDLDEARAVVDRSYDVTDREALLLDELIAQSRDAEAEAAERGSFRHLTSRESGQLISNGGSYTSESDEPARSHMVQANGASDGEASTAESASESASEETAVESEY